MIRTPSARMPRACAVVPSGATDLSCRWNPIEMCVQSHFLVSKDNDVVAVKCAKAASKQ